MVAEGGAVDVDLAVSAARAAFEDWRFTPQRVRSAILLRWARVIEDHVEEPARIQTHENGKTLAEMRGAAAAVGSPGVDAARTPIGRETGLHALDAYTPTELPVHREKVRTR